MRKETARPPRAAELAALAGSRSRVLRQARRMLRDECQAEDAAQDAMLAAVRHLDDFRGEAQLGTWLTRVCQNAVRMILRSERRAANRTVRAAAALPAGGSWLTGSYTAAEAQARLEEAERRQRLLRAVDRLPEGYRSVVRLCDLDDQPVDEVARSLQLSPAGVRTRRLRAHRMLREMLLDFEGALEPLPAL